MAEFNSKIEPVDKPLTQKEMAFAHLYVAGNSGAKSVRDAGYNCRNACVQASQLIRKPNVAKYIEQLRKEAHTEAIATSQEVMEFLTKVMRGQIREHNGKQISVAERSRAAVELAKRTIDIDNGVQQDNTVNVVLDWKRRTPKPAQNTQDPELHAVKTG